MLAVAALIGLSARADVKAAARAQADPEFAAAYATALAMVDGVSQAECRDLDRNPDKHPCIVVLSPDSDSVSTPAQGIATFGVGEPDGGGFLLVLGRAADGSWQFWQGTQQPSSVYALPGIIRACTGGDRLNVRAAPNLEAEVVASIADRETATAEEFLLTEPGVYPRQNGQGWYRISSPAVGWVAALYVSEPNVETRSRQPLCTFANSRRR